jgi:catechol 2,3-dioxygenase-like lactoylglutathione lyase family enzyme
MAADTSKVLEGPIRQVGYVVRDLDAAIRSWCALGVGPWFTMRNLEQKDCQYRGKPCELTISIAFANSGPMQIELIQPHGETPSIFREFLEARGEGFHQFAWWVTDFDAMMQKAAVAGWPIVWSGGTGGTRFAYFELDSTISTVVEVSELNDATQGLADLVASAAEQWDGFTNPVRSLR